MFSKEDLFAKALMVEKPWFVDKVQFDQEGGKLEIWIDFERDQTFYYEDKESGVKGHFKAYNTSQKTWRYLNFFQYQCYLHAWIPRIDIGDGKVTDTIKAIIYLLTGKLDFNKINPYYVTHSKL